MDTKVIAIIIAAVVVVGGASAFVILNNDGNNTDDSRFNIISRVNSEGSGIYIKADLVEFDANDMPVNKANGTSFFTVVGDKWTVTADNKSAWDGLTFGTPGTPTIQHTQLADLAHTMGLDFKLTGKGTGKGAMYYDSGMASSDKIISNTVIDGGIIWEPQHQVVIANEGYVQLALTNDIFPNHTCCVIAGNEKYMKSNVETTERFLQGYIKSVDDINRILLDPKSQDYSDFLKFVEEKVPALKGKTESTKAALANINYLYADDNGGDLSGLKASIADLVVNLAKNEVLKNEIVNPSAFADKFVDDSYIKGAITNKYEDNGNTTIKVAVISGDIHQIAIHWASEQGFFSGITLSIVENTNGGGVATSIVNGEAQYGFLGAPPATITTVNSGYITA